MMLTYLAVLVPWLTVVARAALAELDSAPGACRRARPEPSVRPRGEAPAGRQADL
jgi:hypothetical protein